MPARLGQVLCLGAIVMSATYSFAAVQSLQEAAASGVTICTGESDKRVRVVTGVGQDKLTHTFGVVPLEGPRLASLVVVPCQAEDLILSVQAANVYMGQQRIPVPKCILVWKDEVNISGSTIQFDVIRLDAPKDTPGAIDLGPCNK